MHNIVIQYTDTLRDDHQNKSNYHPSIHKLVAMLLTVFLMCTLYPCDIYFIAGNLYLLIPFIYFICPFFFSFGDHQFVLCNYNFVSSLFCLFCFVFNILHVSEIIWYLFFSVYLSSLRKYLLGPSMLLQMTIIF